MIVELNSIASKVIDKINNPVANGISTGFQELNEYYRIVMGRTTYIGGIPSHGKSTFLFEVLIRTAEQFGLKHLIFAPEEGDASEIYTTLIAMYCRKKNKIGAFNKLTEQDFYSAQPFISSFFYVYDTNEVTVEPTHLFKELTPYIKEKDINTITLDPWNEMKHDFSQHGGRQDSYLEFVLGAIRQLSRKLHVHTFIIAHPRTLQKNRDSNTYEPPTAFEFSGGGAWYAKADSILCVYRPNEFSEIESERTKVDIIVQKAKRMIGKKGIINLDFDLHTQRYKSLVEDIFYNKPTF